MAIRILRSHNVQSLTGRSRSSTYNDIDDGLFPPPVLIGLRAVGWPDYEVDAVNAARIAGATDGDIRELVSKLVEARKALAWTGGQQ